MDVRLARLGEGFGFAVMYVGKVLGLQLCMRPCRRQRTVRVESSAQNLGHGLRHIRVAPQVARAKSR